MSKLFKKRSRAILPLLLMALWSCNPTPEPIRYGEDGCAHCRMLIMDQKFGAELVTQKGKIYKFDSIECLVAFYENEGTLPKAEVHSLWITPFNQPGELIEAPGATYLHSPELPSPMGVNLSGFASDEAALDMHGHYKGDILKWQDLSAVVRKAWSGQQ